MQMAKYIHPHFTRQIVETQILNQLASEKQRILSEGNGILYFNVFLFEERNCRQPYLALARQLSISILRFLRLVITMPRAGAILLGESLVESTFFYGFMDQNFPRSWDQGSNFWVKIWNQL